MSDEIQRASSALKELNDNALKGEKIFQGFFGTMVEVAAKTDGAGKAWTTFSRLTSGSPIWKLQNKARAYLSILASFQERALRAEKAQREQNKAAVDAILNADKLVNEYNDLKKTYDSVSKGIGEYTAEQESALQSTVAFSEAIMAGKSKNEAYTLSLISLHKLTKANREEVTGFLEARKKAAAFEKLLNTSEGRGQIRRGIEYDKKQAFDRLTGRNSTQSERSGPKGFLKALKSVFGLKQREKTNIHLIKQLKGSKGLGDALKILTKELPQIAKNSSFAKKILSTYTTVRLMTSKFALKFQKKILSMVLGAAPLLSLAFKGFVYLILGILLFMVFAKIAYDIFGVMKDFGVMDDIGKILTSVVSIIGNIFSIFGAFMSGDFELMFDYLGDILDDVIAIAYNVALVAAKAGFAILVGFFFAIVDFIDYFFLQEGWKVVLPALLKVGAILLVAYFVKWSIGQALLLLGIYALPIGMAIVIAAAFVALYRKVAGHPALEIIVFGMTAIIGILAFLAGGWVLAAGAFIGLLIMGLAKKFKFFEKATGGTSHGGMTLVGEQGPELVNLPAGATVKTNTQTNRMMGGTTVNNYITINAKDTSKAEMRRIANELSNMINMKVNRSGSSRTMG